jgi:hypothetical protein
MGLVEDLALIAEKVDELKAASDEITIHFSFNEISLGYDYQIRASIPNAPAVQASSLDATEIVAFLDGILNQL